MSVTAQGRYLHIKFFQVKKMHHNQFNNFLLNPFKLCWSPDIFWGLLH